MMSKIFHFLWYSKVYLTKNISCRAKVKSYTIFIWIVAVATNFGPARVQLLFEGVSYYFGHGYDVDDHSIGSWETYFVSATDTVWAFRRLGLFIAWPSLHAQFFVDRWQQTYLASTTAQRTSVHTLLAASAWWLHRIDLKGRFSTRGKQT